jgi:hypothetical protein
MLCHMVVEVNVAKVGVGAWGVLPPYTHLGDVKEIFNPLGVSLGASES